MQKLFNSYLGPKLGLSIDPNWKYIRSGLQRNIAQTVLYYRSKNFSVKNNHILVSLLNSASVSIFSDIETFYASAQNSALRLSSIFKLTSSIYRGEVFDGVFLGKGIKEVIIASDDYRNPYELEANWQDIEAVTFLDHPKSDTSLLLANGKSYSIEDGYAVININIPALLVQYRGWLKEQKEVFDSGGSPYPTSVFIHKYVLPNMLHSQLDVALFNRAYNLVTGAPMGVPMYRHAFNLINYDDRIDKALKTTVKKLTEHDRDFYTMMREVPLVHNENLLEFAKLPSNAPTRQIVWAELVARLKLLAFIFDANPSHGKKLSRDQINHVKRVFDLLQNSNGLEQVPDRSLVRDIEAEILRLRLTCM